MKIDQKMLFMLRMQKMSNCIPLIEAHNKIMQVIPVTQKNLITDIEEFMITKKNVPSDKMLYSNYLQVLLRHMPPRLLRNSDPEWMWKCQEIFSGSFHGI
jgi:hypothetical protein